MSATKLAQGDAYPLVVRLRDSHGQPVTPPSDATATFRMVERSSKAVVAGAVVLSGDTATWTPSTSNTAIPGIYDAQFTVTYPNGEVRHFPTEVGPGALSGFVVEVCANP